MDPAYSSAFAALAATAGPTVRPLIQITFMRSSSTPCRAEKHWIGDAPRLFDIILTRKQRGVSLHGIAQHSFVRIRLLCAGVVTHQQLHRLAQHLLLRIHHGQTKGARDIAPPAARILFRPIPLALNNA